MSDKNLRRSHQSTGSRTICTVSPTTIAVTARNAGPNRAGKLEAPERGFHAGKKASAAANSARLLTLSRHGDGGTTPPTFTTPPSANFALKWSTLPPPTGAGARAALLPLKLPSSRVPLPMSHRYRDHNSPNIVHVQVTKIAQLNLPFSSSS